MKQILFLTVFLLSPALAFAGDNGSYDVCVSATGRTKLVLGNVGSMQNERTVELIIDKQTYGPAKIDEDVLENVLSETITRYTEADHDGTNWVTIKRHKDSDQMTILSGLDPRTGRPLKSKIQLTCQTVFNPI
jgi:hypothetical protein